MFGPKKEITRTVAYILYTIGLLFGVAPFLYAQNANRSNFDLEAAHFAAEDRSLTRLDIYIRITNEQIQFIKANDQFLAEYEVVIDVFDDSGLIVDGKEFKEKVMTERIEETSDQTSSHVSTVTFLLEPSDYDIVVELQDLETLSKSVKKISVSLPDYNKPDVFVSDIVTLDSYSWEGNDLIIQPRLTTSMSARSDIYLFFEVYDVPEGDSFEIRYDIKGPDDKSRSDKIVKQSSGSTSEILIEIARDSLRHGLNQVDFQVTYLEKSMNIEHQIKWYIEGLPLSFTNIAEAIEALKYIASDNEYDRLMNLDEHEQYAAYLEFWRDKDLSPGTADNELRREYYSRIEYANAHYRVLRKPGWKTDMGLVYVKLGPPDSIDRNPFNNRDASAGPTVKAIEVWNYNEHRKRLFFVDESGYGEYRLTNRVDFFDILR